MAVGNIIDKWGVRLVDDLKKSLVDKGVTFQKGGESRLAASIKYEITYTDKGLTFELSMADQWYWVDKGRKAGNVSKEGQEKIGAWAAKKGIVEPFRLENLKDRKELQLKNANKNKPKSGKKRKLKTLKKMPFDMAQKSLGYVISRSIAAKGYSKKNNYEGTKFYSDIIEGKKAELRELLNEFYKKEIVVQFGEG